VLYTYTFLLRDAHLELRLIAIIVSPLELSITRHLQHPYRNKTDLLKQLGELKTELLSLRVQKIAGGSAAKLTKM
jgi:hypothetical protein